MLCSGRGDETPRVVLFGGREVTLQIERHWTLSHMADGHERSGRGLCPGGGQADGGT